jgi:large subunit ribosomal protein L13
MQQKTYVLKAAEIERQWYVVDAEGKTLGRLSSDVAHVLRGKHKPTFSPHMDTGDYVIIVNADKIEVTGKRAEQKMYYSHSMYPGGLRERSYKEVLKNHPRRILERAIRGMLPRNVLGDDVYRKLKVYAGPTHPHEAQKPRKLEEAMYPATRHAVGAGES